MATKQSIGIRGSYVSKKGSVRVSLSLIAYKEKGIEVIYSPDLDMFGYGKTEKEARNSFAITLDEYFRYTLNKSTLFKDLTQHGWTIKDNKKKPTIIPPDAKELLLKNEQFREIYNAGDFKKYSQNVDVPVFC